MQTFYIIIGTFFHYIKRNCVHSSTKFSNYHARIFQWECLMTKVKMHKIQFYSCQIQDDPSILTKHYNLWFIAWSCLDNVTKHETWT
jgi:hypothetical protein